MQHTYPVPSERQGHERREHHGSYGRLAIMVGLSIIAMYGLMYAMVDRLANVHLGFDQLYMAILMAAAMVIIELALMGRMYPRRSWNVAIMIAAVVALAGSWFAIREQAGIGDGELLRAMIPHHAGAILMCEEASLEDPEVKALCGSIVAGQQAEITWMKAKLDAR